MALLWLEDNGQMENLEKIQGHFGNPEEPLKFSLKFGDSSFSLYDGYVPLLSEREGEESCTVHCSPLLALFHFISFLSFFSFFFYNKVCFYSLLFLFTCNRLLLDRHLNYIRDMQKMIFIIVCVYFIFPSVLELK